MKSYKMLKDFGDFKEGDVIDAIQLNEEVIVADLVADGTFFEEVVKTQEELDTEVKAAADAQASSDVAAVAVTDQSGEQVVKTFVFNGKTVISKTVRVVEDKEIHHVKLEDGTEMDLSDEEHQAMVLASNVA